MKIRLIVPCEPFYYCGQTAIDHYGPAIASIAGGFTATQGTGGWNNADGVLVVEPVTVFDCYVVPDGEVCGRFLQLAQKIAKELKQDCVYLEIDSIVQLVKP